MKPRSRKLTKDETEAMLASGDWEADREYWEPGRHGMTGYKSAKNAGLLVTRSGQRAVLYESREEVLRISRETASMKPRHMLDDRMPEGATFVEQVPALVDELAEKLDIPRAALDASIESLAAVDAAVRKRRPRRCLEAPIFSALVAYVGEVMRKHTGGRWELRPSGDVHEPWIVAGGAWLAPFAVVFRELAEPHAGGCSIQGSTAGEIGAKGFTIPPFTVS